MDLHTAHVIINPNITKLPTINIIPTKKKGVGLKFDPHPLSPIIGIDQP